MTKMLNRREFLPLAGAGAIMAPTIITGCSTSTEPDPISIPGTIAFQRVTSYSSDIYIMDWSAEHSISLTANIPGKHARPFWGPGGQSLYFDSEVEGKNSINRINDLTDPVESLESVVNEAEHQFQPIVHSGGELLIYSLKADSNPLTNAKLVAYDLSSDTVISMSENTTGLVDDYTKPEDKKFLPGERRVLFTGSYPVVGIFDPDTGGVENHDFTSNTRSLAPDSIAITSSGTVYATGLAFSNYDSIMTWDIVHRSIRNIHTVLDRFVARSRMMTDLIERPDEHIMLLSCRTGYPQHGTPWKMGYINLGNPDTISDSKRYTTVAFDNLDGDNFWPRFTSAEHI